MSCYIWNGKRPVLGERVFLAPGCALIGDVTVGDDASVWFNAVLRGDLEPIAVGARSNVQDGAVLHTDAGLPCLIGEDVTIGHGAIVHGAVVEDGATIGMGAIVLSGARIGAGAIVAAGAVVPEGREVPPGCVAMGTPARPVRQVRDDERERMTEGARHYVVQQQSYRQPDLFRKAEPEA